MTDRQLLRFVAEFRKGILGKDSSHRMCFAVCAPLVTLLRMYGVKADLIEGAVGESNHFWMRLPDGRVLDPTADQFDGALPPVYLGPPLAIHAEPSPDRRR